MQGFIKAVLGKTNIDAEFTLTALVLVIGIILALAVITVPLVTKFAIKGYEGALEAAVKELGNVRFL